MQSLFKFDRDVTIIHNHGTLTLRNAEWIPHADYDSYKHRILSVSTTGFGEIRGEVVDGGRTSRLFTATAYEEFKKGSLESAAVHIKKFKIDHEGDIVADCQFCG